jgi:ubiquinone/menaquinone biosynthesis C-methylase UbiE
MEERGLRERRRALLRGLHGDVLEIGAGTGLNLEHYADDVRLVLAEPEPAMAARLAERLAASGREAEIVAARAEALPFPDASFDAVVSTLVLCSVRSVPEALGEIRRVLRPGGTLALIEHVRGQGGTAILQEVVAPASRLLFACAPNRETSDAVRSAGFDLDETAFELAGSARWTRPAIQGLAARRP